ncbi:hypothetical protein N6L24_05800 [Cognatishimia sp. SS12]|nr:hypothetical protein [Cognatishimia sp. SS12]
MWGQIDGVAKIDTARTAMRSMLDDLDPESQLALVAYGHRSQGDCNDIEVIAGLGELENQQILDRLEGLTPTGKTPISGALAAAGGVFQTNDAINQVVLISDGIETCGGNPCETAKTLAAMGAETKVHAVGFDVDASAREQLKCIADAGRGIYLDAADARGLNSALAEVTRVAQVVTRPEPPAPTPKAPVRVSAYLDDFDPDMAGDWTVNNPNPEGFIVEDSNLLILNSGPAGFDIEGSENFMTLDTSVLPQGDWDATVTFAGEFKTGRDSLWFGLWKDKDNYLGAQFWANRSRTNTCDSIGLSLKKKSSGTETKFETPLIGDFGCGGPTFEEYDTFMERFALESAQLTLHKRGRSYYATLDIGDGDQDTHFVMSTEKLTSLRSPGGLALSVGVFNPEGAQGEALLFVDKLEITSIEN